MRRFSSVLMAGIALLVLAAACSSDDVPPVVPTVPAAVAPTAIVEPTIAPTAAPEPTAMMEEPAMMTGPTVIAVGTNDTLGSFLVDGEGKTLYLFTNDERNVSNCAGGCATAWPPLHTNGEPMVLEGLNEARAGTITREDGMTQHTYNGWPLYHFASDENPGDTTGQDRGGVWFVVSPDGGPIRTSVAVNLGVNVTLGNILTDDTGKTLYLFTNDERNVSNCAGGCALSWPPLLTVDAPIVGEGLNEGRVGTIDRADGAKQVTYNGWPLYYFAADAKPGDTTGQDRGGVWYVVSSDGGAIRTVASVLLGENVTLGNVLTDATGRTLYLVTNDERNVSNCTGGCALAWPPLLTVDAPTAGEGLNAGRVGTIERADGAKQVTYNGWPLYYFAADAKPGDATGQDRGGVWYVVSSHGGAIRTSAIVGIVENTALGTILVDGSGRTLYLFTNDVVDTSNCAGGCALSWPPLLTVDAPTAGEGVTAGLLGTITRADGSTQVTYNGLPLYYYASDDKPGDTNGQDRGNVWFVLTPEGVAVPAQ